MTETLATDKGTVFTSYLEQVSNDPVRAFVPKRLPRKVTVVWLFHAYGSSHDAIKGGYLHTAEAAVDAGFIAICPNLGGSLWSSTRAQALLKATYARLNHVLAGMGRSIAHQVIVGTSHGGALAAYATARKLIPNIRGCYLVNGVFDLEGRGNLYGQLTYASALSACGNVPNMQAANPARLPAGLFDVPVKLVYCLTDSKVLSTRNAQVLESRLRALDILPEVRVHTAGHNTPPGTAVDIIGRVQEWSA